MLKKMKKKINRRLFDATVKTQEHAMNVLNNKRGQTLVEYALILLLVVIVVVGVVALLGDKIQAVFQKIVDALTLSSGN